MAAKKPAPAAFSGGRERWRSGCRSICLDQSNVPVLGGSWAAARAAGETTRRRLSTVSVSEAPCAAEGVLQPAPTKERVSGCHEGRGSMAELLACAQPRPKKGTLF
jgi:hypothetical protein